MRSSRPPAVATWLLEHLHAGSQNDYVTGDLMEAYQCGRSRAWCWKQVLAAIIVSFCQEIMAHPVLAVRAITMGWAICLLYDRGVGPKLLFPLERWLFGLSWSSFIMTSPWVLLMWTESLVLYAASGWTVARLNRRHRTAMVMAFATSVLLFDLQAIPWIWFHGANTLTDSRFLPYLLNDLANLMLRPVVILLGGLWGIPPANELEHQKQHSMT